MDDDDDKRAVLVCWGILTPHFDNWPKEPEIEGDNNVVVLNDYRLH